MSLPEIALAVLLLEWSRTVGVHGLPLEVWLDRRLADEQRRGSR